MMPVSRARYAPVLYGSRFRAGRFQYYWQQLLLMKDAACGAGVGILRWIDFYISLKVALLLVSVALPGPRRLCHGRGAGVLVLEELEHAKVSWGTPPPPLGESSTWDVARCHHCLFRLLEPAVMVPVASPT